jgi:DNA repair exonuclease SbcCD nuclease subunit
MIYATADLHLERFIWAHRWDLDGDAFLALDSLAELILSHRGDETSLILAGDVFDKRRIDGITLEKFAQFVDKLYDKNVTVYFIQGDHDRNSTPLAETPGCVSLNEKLTVIDDLLVYGLDWRPRAELQAALKNVPPCDLLVLHTAFQHLLPWEGAYDITLEDIPAHVRNIFVGDVHLTDKTPFRGDGFCVSPGALHAVSVDQTAPKGVWRLGKGRKNIEWDFCPIWYRRIHRYVVRQPEELAEIRTELEQSSADKQIFEIKYAVTITNLVEELASQYAEKAFFFLKPTAGDKFVKLEKDAGVYDQINLAQALPLCFAREKDPELYDFVDELLVTSGREAIEKKVREIETDKTSAG